MRGKVALLAIALVSCKDKQAEPIVPSPSTSKTFDLALPSAPPPPTPSQPSFTASDLPRIDVHTHVEPGCLPHAIALAAQHHIAHIVNLSGGDVGQGLEESIAEAKAVGHTTVFTTPDFRDVRRGGGFAARMVARLKQAKALGARGVKITKGLGLGYVTAAGTMLAVDDRSLDPLFDAAGKLGMPIAIHTGDPKAFWQPLNVANERFDELVVHPQWSFFGIPLSWEDLYAQFERRVARHPKTTFIGVHFGNDPEDPDRVGQMLDHYPNLMIDTAARIPEIGRNDARHGQKRMRAFFERYQDRILFGTDLGVGAGESDLMLGSMGADPPGPSDVTRFFDSSWRFFETDQKEIPSPTPIQGRWNVDGIALPRAILEKVYFKNAERVIGMKLD